MYKTINATDKTVASVNAAAEKAARIEDGASIIEMAFARELVAA